MQTALLLVKFRPYDVASGGLWGPRRLVDEMLLHVDKFGLKSRLVETQVRERGGGGISPLTPQYDTLIGIPFLH